MTRLFAFSFFVAGNVMAHPGHGMPGWVHPHLADLALIGFVVFIVACIVLAAKK